MAAGSAASRVECGPSQALPADRAQPTSCRPLWAVRPISVRSRVGVFWWKHPCLVNRRPVRVGGAPIGARMSEPVAPCSKRRVSGEASTLDALGPEVRPLRRSAHADLPGSRAGSVSRGTARHDGVVVGRSTPVVLSGEVLGFHQVRSGFSSVAEASRRCPDRSRPSWPLDGTGPSPGPRARRANRRRETRRGDPAGGKAPGRGLQLVEGAPGRRKRRLFTRAAWKRSRSSDGLRLGGRREERQR